MTTCWMALDDTRADTGTIFYVRGSNHWPRGGRGGTFHAPDDWLGARAGSRPPGTELELVPIEVPAGGAAFHDGWTFHGSPPNERADAERRSVISHLVRTDTRWSDGEPHPIYSRYRRPGEGARRGLLPRPWRENGGAHGLARGLGEPLAQLRVDLGVVDAQAKASLLGIPSPVTHSAEADRRTSEAPR